jgi:hypothetical protein
MIYCHTSSFPFHSDTGPRIKSVSRVNQVERAKAITRTPSQESSTGSAHWKRLQSGGASGIVLRTASMLSAGKVFETDRQRLSERANE